jgi:hypothetical protein
MDQPSQSTIENQAVAETPVETVYLLYWNLNMNANLVLLCFRVT